LLIDRQGKHAKLKSLIKNKDFSDNCQAWLHQKKPESHSPNVLKMYIEGIVFPQMGIYYNGHEQSDVVIYRKEWLNRMFEYRKYMKSFNGKMLDIVIEPQLESSKKELVQVTYDECHFYANDDQRRIWIGKDEDILRPKDKGCSVMVSAFLCPFGRILEIDATNQ
ncbi:15844_t:CDS:2, partial [Acaulospora morrowiae]